MKAVEQYFYGALFTMLYRVDLTFKCVDETLACDHPNETCSTLQYLYVERLFLDILQNGALGCFFFLIECELGSPNKEG